MTKSQTQRQQQTTKFITKTGKTVEFKKKPKTIGTSKLTTPSSISSTSSISSIKTPKTLDRKISKIAKAIQEYNDAVQNHNAKKQQMQQQPQTNTKETKNKKQNQV